VNGEAVLSNQLVDEIIGEEHLDDCEAEVRDERKPVLQTDAVVEEVAVMVELVCAPLTDRTVF